MIAAVEAEDVPDASLLAEIQDGLRRLAPALGRPPLSGPV